MDWQLKSQAAREGGAFISRSLFPKRMPKQGPWVERIIWKLMRLVSELNFQAICIIPDVWIGCFVSLLMCIFFSWRSSLEPYDVVIAYKSLMLINLFILREKKNWSYVVGLVYARYLYVLLWYCAFINPSTLFISHLFAYPLRDMQLTTSSPPVLYSHVTRSWVVQLRKFLFLLWQTNPRIATL